MEAIRNFLSGPVLEGYREQVRGLLAKTLPSLVKKKPLDLPRSTIACDFGASKILLLEAVKGPGPLTINRFHRIQRAENQNPADLLREAFQTGVYPEGPVRISVKGQSVVVRFIKFPKMKPEELKSALVYEAENYIPFKLNEVLLDYAILEPEIEASGGKEMNLLLVAVRKEEIENLLKPFQEAGRTVEFIDMDVLASINSLEFFYPEDFQRPIALLDIGKEISSVSVFHSGKPRFIRDTSYGGMDIVKKLKRKLGLTEQAATEILESEAPPSPEVLAVLKEGYESLVSDLKVTLDYYLEQVPLAKPVEKLFIGGGVGDPRIIDQALSKPLGIPVQFMEIFPKISVGEGADAALIKKNQGQLPVALGLCLRP